MNTRTIRSALFVIMATLTLAACSADNQTGENKDGARGKSGKPPAEAFTACESKSEGQSCSITSSRGEMSGTCKAPPQGEGSLACVPEGMEKGQRPRR